MDLKTRRTVICYVVAWAVAAILNIVLILNGWKLGPLGFGIVMILGITGLRVLFAKREARDDEVLKKLDEKRKEKSDDQGTP